MRFSIFTHAAAIERSQGRERGSGYEDGTLPTREDGRMRDNQDSAAIEEGKMLHRC
jgi:hypothetical protein